VGSAREGGMVVMVGYDILLMRSRTWGSIDVIGIE
jgi:hypothetical protein